MTTDLTPAGCARVLVPPAALVQTRDGELPAAHLLPGDDIVAREAGFLELAGVARVRLGGELVAIASGFLPGMAPSEPLVLWAGQAIRWRRGLRTARALVADGIARMAEPAPTVLVELSFAAEDVIFAGGLALAIRSETAARAA